MPEKLIANRYIQDNELGSGGMGTVYRGMDSLTQKPVAIKRLKAQIAQPEMIERFRREGDALRDLNHPNIVKMLDMLEENGQHFLVMEYVSGGDLKGLIEQHGKLNFRRCVDMAIDLADALTRAHRLNIIHRDLKPANVLIADDGTLRLTDFGVAHIGSKARVTDTDAIVGTIDYLPPEVFSNEPFDFRGDIWAFGVMLFEMLSGQRPFTGDSMVATVTSILTAPLPNMEVLSPETPTALIDLVYRMLERDPGARISSVRHVGAALEDILADRRVTSQPARFETPPDHLRRPIHNLPAQTTPFVGREHELAELDKLLADPALRLITVIAPGGMGKTRLALEAGTRAVSLFENGVFFVELAPLFDPNSIVLAIANAAGYPFQNNGRTPQQQIGDFLSTKSLLLVMDNFEHLLDGSGLVTELLNAAPKLKIFVTSRQRLAQPGETLFHLSGMDFPDWETPEDALRYAAVKLFMNSARRARPDFELTQENMKFVARICRMVQGMPLGILLAASWVAMLSVEEIAAMVHSLDFLATDEAELPERQRSIRGVMAYSWQQMTDDERQVFMRLSVFRGGFRREAAEAAAGANLRSLMSLTNKSFIRRDSKSGRYEIHELLRQYGEEQLLDSSAVDTTRERHALFFSEFLRKLWEDLKGRRQLEALKDVDAEMGNIRVAWRWLVDHHRARELAEAASSLGFYAEMYALHFEAVELFASAVEAVRAYPPDGEEAWTLGHLLARLAWPSFIIGQNESGFAALESGMAILGNTDHSEETMMALILLSLVKEVWLSQREEAIRIGREIVDLARPHDNRWALGNALVLLVGMLDAAGNTDEAKSVAVQGLTHASAVGDLWTMARAQIALGQIAYRQQDYVEAESFCRQSLEQFELMKKSWGIMESSILLGKTLVKMERETEAKAVFQKALGEVRPINVIYDIAQTIFNIVESYFFAYDAAFSVELLATLFHSLEWQQDRFRPLINRLKEQLPGDIYEAAWQRGSQRTLDQAAALVLERLG